MITTSKCTYELSIATGITGSKVAMVTSESHDIGVEYGDMKTDVSSNT